MQDLYFGWILGVLEETLEFIENSSLFIIICFIVQILLVKVLKLVYLMPVKRFWFCYFVFPPECMASYSDSLPDDYCYADVISEGQTGACRPQRVQHTLF